MTDQSNTDRRTFLKLSAGAGSALTIGVAGCSGGGDGGGDGSNGGSDGDGGTDGGDGSDGGGSDSGDGGGSDSGDGGGNDLSRLGNGQVSAAIYPVIPHGLPMLIGLEQGLFEENGIDVTPDDIVSTGGGGGAVRSAQSSNIPIGWIGPGTVAKAYVAGANIHIVSLASAIPDVDWQTKADSDIETIQDLNMDDRKGKIGVTQPGATTETQAVLSVQNADGISLDDVEIVHTGGVGEAISAFQEGIVDVGMNTNPTATSMLEGGVSRRVWHTRDFVPDYTEDVIFMDGNYIDNEPEAARQWLRGWIDAQNWIKENTEEAGRIWASASDWEEENAIKGLKATQPERFFQAEVRKGIIDNIERGLRFDGTLREQQSLDKQGLVRDEVLPEEYQADWVER